jgi:hypothetical protein
MALTRPGAGRVCSVVMPALVAGIHVFATAKQARRGWPGQARPRLRRDASIRLEYVLGILTHVDSANRMDALTLFGLVAVTAMLVFYAFEERSPVFILAFAAACGLASVYGFLQGAWPFGLVEAVWAAVAVQRWRVRVRKG